MANTGRLEGRPCRARVADRLRDKGAYRALVVELHLALGGMDVHVHLRGVEFEEEARDGVTAFHQRGVVALHEREVQRAVLDGAAVDEEMLVIARATRDPGRADETPEADCRLPIADCRLLDGGGVGQFRVGAARVHGEDF